MQDRFLKRLRKKAKKGMHGWPAATICFYGPDASRASKVVVGIVASEHAEVGEMRNWKLDAGAMTDRVIGCPHQEGIDYQGQWCPVCEFWKGRDRFTGERVH
jgi:hypothetical protein